MSDSLCNVAKINKKMVWSKYNNARLTDSDFVKLKSNFWVIVHQALLRDDDDDEIAYFTLVACAEKLHCVSKSSHLSILCNFVKS